MILKQYDCFENYSEMSKAVKKLQSRSLEYMRQIDSWELPRKSFHTRKKSHKKELVLS